MAEFDYAEHTLTGAAIGTEFTRSGLSFDPVFVLVYELGPNASFGSIVSHSASAIGMFTATAAVSLGVTYTDNQATSWLQGRISSGLAITTMQKNGGSGVDGLFTGAMITGGYKFTVTDDMAGGSRRFGALAIGGAGVEAFVEATTLPVGLGTFDLAGTGITNGDIALFLATTRAAALNSVSSVQGGVSFGAAKSAVSQGCVGYRLRGSYASGAQTYSIANASHVLLTLDNVAAGVDTAVQFDSWIAGGMRLNKISGGNATAYGYAVLKGVGADIRWLISQLSTGSWEETGMSITPKAIVLASTFLATADQAVSVDGARFSLGAGVSAALQGASGLENATLVTPTDSMHIGRNDAIALKLARSAPNAFALDAQIGLLSFAPSTGMGAVFDQTIADSAANRILSIAFGDAGGAPGPDYRSLLSAGGGLQTFSGGF